MIQKYLGDSGQKAEKQLTVEEAWTQLEAKLAKSPKVLRSFRPGASSQEIDALSKAVGEVFPPDLRSFLQIHDGQRGNGFIKGPPDVLQSPPFRLLSVSEISQTWKEWDELQKGGDFASNKPQPHPGVRKAWFHPGWIPISDDGLGNHHCVDLAPTKEGKLGQIIILWHESQVRPVVADNLTRWMTGTADSIS